VCRLPQYVRSSETEWPIEAAPIEKTVAEPLSVHKSRRNKLLPSPLVPEKPPAGNRSAGAIVQVANFSGNDTAECLFFARERKTSC
jgi:hypothetical protein